MIETLEESVKYVKVTIKTPERGHRRCSCVVNVNFGHISQQFLVFLLLNLNKQILARTLNTSIGKRIVGCVSLCIENWIIFLEFLEFISFGNIPKVRTL